MSVSQEYMAFPDFFQSFANTGIWMLLAGIPEEYILFSVPPVSMEIWEEH